MPRPYLVPIPSSRKRLASYSLPDFERKETASSLQMPILKQSDKNNFLEEVTPLLKSPAEPIADSLRVA